MAIRKRAKARRKIDQVNEEALVKFDEKNPSPYPQVRAKIAALSEEIVELRVSLNGMGNEVGGVVGGLKNVKDAIRPIAEQNSILSGQVEALTKTLEGFLAGQTEGFAPGYAPNGQFLVAKKPSEKELIKDVVLMFAEREPSVCIGKSQSMLESIAKDSINCFRSETGADFSLSYSTYCVALILYMKGLILEGDSRFKHLGHSDLSKAHSFFREIKKTHKLTTEFTVNFRNPSLLRPKGD